MTAEEIRCNGLRTSPRRDQQENDEQKVMLLAEIAAQLAEIKRELVHLRPSSSKGEL